MFSIRFFRIAIWIFLITNCSFSKNELPIFSDRVKCSEEELPIFVQPASDVADGNGLEASYCSSRKMDSGKRIELSLVFQDERHPSFWKDPIYRIYRSFKYGRVKDIESLRLQFLESGELSTIHLKNVYAGDQIFASDPVEHYDAVLKPDQIVREQKRPVLYVNTWNHMFKERDSNPQLPKKTWTRYTIHSGSRDELDAFYSSK